VCIFFCLWRTVLPGGKGEAKQNRSAEENGVAEREHCFHKSDFCLGNGFYFKYTINFVVCAGTWAFEKV
jgi:hypothetical protein